MQQLQVFAFLKVLKKRLSLSQQNRVNGQLQLINQVGLQQLRSQVGAAE